MSMLVNPDLNGRLLVQSLPSMTQPQFAAEADINLIVDRFTKTNVLPTRPAPVFGDASLVPRGTDALALVRKAQMMWEALPPEIRAAAGSMDKLSDFALTEYGQSLIARFAPPPVKEEVAGGQGPAAPAAAPAAGSKPLVPEVKV